MDSAMDLSLRNSTSSPQTTMRLVSNPVAIMSPSSSLLPKLLESNTDGKGGGGGVQIVRPIPRPPWSILWYQNLWSMSANQQSAPSDRDTGENSKICRVATTFRTNERSSFSVLNNLSTNRLNFNNSCGNNSNDNHNYTFPNVPMEQQQHQHQHLSSSQISFQFPMTADKCCDPVMSVAESGSIAVTTTGTSLCKLKQRQDVGARSKYSSGEDDSDSDNSENIVVTTTRDSMLKSPSLDREDLAACLLRGNIHPQHDRQHQANVILDVACCDGPVQFKRVSNPNFALTVEHNDVCSPASPPANINASNIVATTTSTSTTTTPQVHHQYHDDHQSFFSSSQTTAPEGGHNFNNGAIETGDLNMAVTTAKTATTSTTTTTVTTHKSYLCIYCNQSFKSLFCYQKHKKRHLNPVSVDITTTTANSTSYRGSGGGCVSGGGSSNKKGNTTSGGASNSGGGGGGSGGGGGGGGIIGIIPENTKAKTKDLNVQFFPCKKCGCKFPSYYFVHKHKKICH